MRRFLTLFAFLVFVGVAHSAAASERRFALVIGNGSYSIGTLPTSVNDAALIAQSLEASGFEVSSLRNLNEASLRQSFRDFLVKVKNAGPETVVAVYFAGLGLQCEGENYLLPIDAEVSQPSDLVRHALPLSEQTHSLAALHVKASLLIIDAARPSPFLLSGQPAASGLAWTEPEANMLLAFNATPGTVERDSTAGGGAYAIALAEMIRQGGLGPEDLFDRVRLRVNELTNGAQVPWDATNIRTRFEFSERDVGAPKRADLPERSAWMRSQPMRKLSPDDAYWIALLRDTFDGYAEFLAEYWNDPMAKRVEALLATRREAITWRRSHQTNVPDAYWTYLERYPHGPHVADAERLLTRLGAAITPPAQFRGLDYDVPPPLPAELEFTDQAVLSLDDPAFAFAPLKPPPAYFLEAPPSELQASAQPSAASGKHALPRPPPLLSSPTISVPSQTPEPPNELAIGTVAPTNGNARGGNPGMREGEGGSLSLPGAAGVGSNPVRNSNQTSLVPSVSQIGELGSPSPPAASSPLEDANASPGPLLPAWASLLPDQNKTMGGVGTTASTASNGIGQPLFVSAALAPVPLLAGRKVAGTPVASARSGSNRAAPAIATARLSRGSARPLTTGTIAPAGPLVAPAAGRARTLTAPVHALTTANIVPSGSRPAPQLATGAQGRTLRGPGQPTQATPLPNTRATRLVVPPAGNAPKPAAGAAPTPTAADSQQAASVRKRKPEPPMTLAPNPGVSSASAASQKNPCTVSNGRLNCGEAR